MCGVSGPDECGCVWCAIRTAVCFAVRFGQYLTVLVCCLHTRRADDNNGGFDPTQSENSDQFITYWQGRDIFRRNHPNGLYNVTADFFARIRFH